MNASDSTLNVTPEPHAGLGDLALPHLDDRWFTLREAGAECRRHHRTIANYVSRFQLKRRTAYVVRRRHRQKVVMLSASTVAWLREVTLWGNREALKRPPR
jgi:hypothetical protein